MARQLTPELAAGFFEEARGYVPAAEACLEALSHNMRDADALNELYRVAHSLRGVSGAVGLDEVAQVAQGAEDLAEAVNAGDLPMDTEVLDLFRDALMRIAAHLNGTSAPAAPKAAEVHDVPEELVEGFLVEAAEQLEFAAQRLVVLETEPGRSEYVLEVRRAIHTIKGSAGMVGLTGLSRLAHRMEDLLDAVSEGRVPYGRDVHQLLLGTLDVLAEIVGSGGRTEEHAARIDQLFAAYAKRDEGGEAEPETETPAAAVASREPVDSTRTVRVPLERLEELIRSTGELFVTRAALERHLAAQRREIEELGWSLRRLRRVASRFESEYAAFSPGGDTGSSEFDALEFDRYTEFHLLSRDLLEASADITGVERRLLTLSSELDSYQGGQGRIASGIQDQITRLRMVALSTIASRLERTVRSAAQKTGKKAELFIVGPTTEFDKLALEQMAGPLEHLLRNAVSHGIEMPEVRRRNGKPSQGRVTLRASHEGSQAVLRLEDDGAGIDIARIREQAARLGLGTPEELAAIDPRDLYSLVFLPGFSTSPSVTEISGRGVGLDVVRSAVESLKGTISIDSAAGSGTTFAIRLPLSLAVERVLLVEAGGQLFALPLAAVSQVARAADTQTETIGKRQLVRLGGRLSPVASLAALLGLPVSTAASASQAVVGLRIGDDTFAITVDAVQEARETLIKPATGLLARAAAVAGATILGDGSVALALSPAALARLQSKGLSLPRVTPATPASNFEVLIVDDSITVRRMAALSVKNHGWTPLQAKDGVEGLEMLATLSRLPGAILLDVEMPRMDGFEFLSSLKGNPAYREIPVVMLTSRAGAKHREKAFACGASQYLVKPYQEDVLVTALQSCMEGSLV